MLHWNATLTNSHLCILEVGQKKTHFLTSHIQLRDEALIEYAMDHLSSHGGLARGGHVAPSRIETAMVH